MDTDQLSLLELDPGELARVIQCFDRLQTQSPFEVYGPNKQLASNDLALAEAVLEGFNSLVQDGGIQLLRDVFDRAPFAIRILTAFVPPEEQDKEWSQVAASTELV